MSPVTELEQRESSRDGVSGGGFAEVGAGVAAILEAAEQAAEKIRADARKQAAELIHEAEEAVGARLQALTKDGQRVREEAEEEASRVREEAESDARDMRLAVEAYGTKRRREADEEADRTLSEAESRAEELLSRAELKSREADEAAAARSVALREEVRRLEERRRRVVDTLRKISLHLEDALDGEQTTQDPAHEPTAREREQELPEALSAPVRRGRLRR